MESLPVIVKIRMQHKEWAGNVYIGGTHPAAAGGAYMTAIKGFAGITMEDGQIKAHPHLPDGWEKMRFSIFYQGERYEICVTANGTEIKSMGHYKISGHCGDF